MPTPHVLLAWELGANRGHVTSIGGIARALAGILTRSNSSC